MEPDPLYATVSIRVVPPTNEDDPWPTLQDRLGDKKICEGDVLRQLAEQPAVSFCGGVLLPDGVVVTARHCIQECDQASCERGHQTDASVVLGYQMQSGRPPTAEDVQVRPLYVYAVGAGAADWVVLKTPPPEDAHPYRGKLVPSRKFKPGHEYQISHHPLGLPLKHGLGELCEHPDDDDRMRFKATVFNHSSGAPIFSRAGDTLVGIVKGDRQTRYPVEVKDGCYRHTECTDGCDVSHRVKSCGTVVVVPAVWFAQAVKGAQQWRIPEEPVETGRGNPGRGCLRPLTDGRVR
ncbi:MAG: trypsin-like serine peptidase [Nannocystales bacterium]